MNMTDTKIAGNLMNFVVLFFLSLASVSAFASTPNTIKDLRFTESKMVDECKAPNSNWVFCSGFEEGNKDIWDDYDGNPDSSNLIMNLVGPLGGEDNNVMRLRVPSGRGNADLVKVLPSSYDKLYARWYVRWEDGYDFTARNHGSGLFAGDRGLLARSGIRPDGSDRFISLIDHSTDSQVLHTYTYYRGMYMDCADPNGSCWGDTFPCMRDEGSSICKLAEHREIVTPPKLETNKWYCVEMMIDAGDAVSSGTDANGILNYWVDDVEIGPWNNLWFRTDPNLKINILWMNLFHHGDHSVEGVYFDNIVVSTDRVGCL